MKWLDIMKSIAPAALALTPLGKFAPIVIGAIEIAEKAFGAGNGADKKELVAKAIAVGVKAANLANGSIVIDPSAAERATGSAIDLVVGLTNMIHAEHGDKSVVELVPA